MPRRGALTPRKVRQLLKEHGYVEDHQTGSHLIMIHPETRRRVVVPIHSRDLPRGTMLSILRMAGIDPE